MSIDFNKIVWDKELDDLISSLVKFLPYSNLKNVLELKCSDCVLNECCIQKVGFLNDRV